MMSVRDRFSVSLKKVWSSAQQNLQWDLSDQQRLRSDCTSTQYCKGFSLSLLCDHQRLRLDCTSTQYGKGSRLFLFG